MCYAVCRVQKETFSQFLDALSTSDVHTDNNKSAIVCLFNPDSVQNFNHLECFHLVSQVPSSIAFMDSGQELTEEVFSLRTPFSETVITTGMRNNKKHLTERFHQRNTPLTVKTFEDWFHSVVGIDQRLWNNDTVVPQSCCVYFLTDHRKGACRQ